MSDYDVAVHNVKAEYTVEKHGFGCRRIKSLLYDKHKGDTVTIVYTETDPKDSYTLENYDGKTFPLI